MMERLICTGKSFTRSFVVGILAGILAFVIFSLFSGFSRQAPHHQPAQQASITHR